MCEQPYRVSDKTCLLGSEVARSGVRLEDWTGWPDTCLCRACVSFPVHKVGIKRNRIFVRIK